MKNIEIPTFGVTCSNENDLWQRMLVSGLRLMGPKEAASKGYGEREVIVPGNNLRPLTDKEFEAILVRPETPHAIKYVKIAARIGEQAVAIAQATDYKLDPQSPPIDFGDGVIGHVGGTRYDKAGLVNVAMDGKGLFVGEHLDNHRQDPGKRVSAILNMGPGKRLHRIAPDFNLAMLDNPGPDARNAHMRRMIEEGRNVPVYWFDIEPPYEDPYTNELVLDALVNSPVATCLHEGSTFNAAADSQVAYIVDIRGKDTWQRFEPSV